MSTKQKSENPGENRELVGSSGYTKEFRDQIIAVYNSWVYDKQKNSTSIISFELKLKNWKRAAKQAFRYKSFSNLSYVVLANKYAKTAIEHIEFFEKYNIGLAKFDENNNFEILYKPALDLPYSENLQQKVANSISKSRRKVKNVNALFA